MFQKIQDLAMQIIESAETSEFVISAVDLGGVGLQRWVIQVFLVRSECEPDFPITMYLSLNFGSKKVK